ncbi:MAG: hypothetical protein R2724_11185 [Bryobacterales bacterium]
MQAIRAASGDVDQGVTQSFFTSGQYTYAAPGGSDVGSTRRRSSLA